MRFLKYLFLFFKFYKIRFSFEKSILYPGDNDELKPILNRFFFEDGKDVFLFKIIHRKSKKIIYIISFDLNKSEIYIRNLN